MVRRLAIGAVGLAFSVACSSSSDQGPGLVYAQEGGLDGGRDAPSPPDSSPPRDAPPQDGPTGLDGSAESGGDVMPPPSNDVSDQYTSGTRLQAKWMVTSDGTQQFETWHDTQLDQDCFFFTAGDGQLRCLPSAGMFANGFDFADPGCSQPLAYFQPYGACTQVPTFIEGYDQSVCPARLHLYAVGLQKPAQHYCLSNGQCAQCTGSTQGTYYGEGPELAATMYVSATTQNGTAGGGLEPVFDQAADGARGFDHWNDATTQKACYFASAADNAIHCLPSSSAGDSGGFVDPGCSVDAYVVQHTGCPDPSLGVKFDQACPQLEHVVMLGGPTSTLYFGSPGMCTASMPSAGFDWYAGGAEIAPSTYPSVTLSPPTGSARLQEVDYMTGGGLLQSSGLYDSMRQESCVFTVAGDGKLRCLPGAMFNGYFSDAACTQPVAAWLTNICGSMPSYAATYDMSTCPQQEHLFSLGGQVQLAMAYLSSGGQCFAIGTTNYIFYSLGAEVPPSSFEAATEVLK